MLSRGKLLKSVIVFSLAAWLCLVNIIFKCVHLCCSWKNKQRQFSLCLSIQHISLLIVFTSNWWVSRESLTHKVQGTIVVWSPLSSFQEVYFPEVYPIDKNGINAIKMNKSLCKSPPLISTTSLLLKIHEGFYCILLFSMEIKSLQICGNLDNLEINQALGSIHTVKQLLKSNLCPQILPLGTNTANFNDSITGHHFLVCTFPQRCCSRQPTKTEWQDVHARMVRVVTLPRTPTLFSDTLGLR